MSKEFRFQVDPTEDLVGREIRWDKELAELHDQGLTVQGVGPDGDYPVRYDFDESGTMTFDEWWKGNPETPWFEVYNLVPLDPPVTVDWRRLGIREAVSLSHAHDLDGSCKKRRLGPKCEEAVASRG